MKSFESHRSVEKKQKKNILQTLGQLQFGNKTEDFENKIKMLHARVTIAQKVLAYVSSWPETILVYRTDNSSVYQFNLEYFLGQIKNFEFYQQNHQVKVNWNDDFFSNTKQNYRKYWISKTTDVERIIFRLTNTVRVLWIQKSQVFFSNRMFYI